MGLGFDPNGYYNDEYLNNQETRNLTLSPFKNAKAVVLFDSSGNEIIPSNVSAGTIVTGTTTVTTAGTPVRITVTSTPIKGVWLSGDTVAGILLYVGDSSVVANVTGQRGICIIPGNNPVFLPINNLNLLYVDAASNGGKLAYATVS